MEASVHGSGEVSLQGDTDINVIWRRFFQLWWEEHGSASVRLYQIAHLAKEAGFQIVVPPNNYDIEKAGAIPTFTRFGMLLQSKHQDVHAGLRLISDRKALGWSPKTSGSTYHLEPQNEPRGYVASGFKAMRGQSEE